MASVEDINVTGNAEWLRHYEPQVPHTIDIPDHTLPQFFEVTVHAYPHNIATIFFGERLTYSQLSEQISRFAAGLQAVGVEQGERVALVLPNSPQFLIALFGALKVGAVVVPLNPAYTARELHSQYLDVGVTTVVADDVAAQRVQEAMVDTQCKRLVLTHSHDYSSALTRLMRGGQNQPVVAPTAPLGDNVYAFLALIRGNEPTPSSVEIRPDDTALILYTGGTTGAPKGVMLSHRNLVANALQMNAWLWDSRGERKDVFLAAIPFFHSYGLTVAMNLAISVGGTLLLLPRFTIREVLRAITRYRPTIFPAVPAIYSAIANHPLAQRYDLRSIRVCISGAVPLPVDVAQMLESMTGARLVEGYGLTEASPVTHCNPVHGERRMGSIGLPVPLTDARVVDPESRAPLRTGDVGEMAVRGPQVMQGYWSQEAETAQVLQEGWLYTGDMARQDDDGYFYTVDRKKDLVLVNGLTVYPREVEEVLCECEKVQEVVVAGVPDERQGEIVKAYVVLKADMDATERELRAFCSERLADYKVPVLIEFREGLPKSSSGKYLRRELVQEEQERLDLRQG